MAEIDEFIARPIPLDLERCDVITQWDFEVCLRTERERPDARMQSVGANDQIDLALGSMSENDPHAVRIILNPHDRVVKDRLDLSFQCLVNGSRKVGATKAREAAICHADEYVGREAAVLAAIPVHKAHLPDLVTQCSYLRKQSHFLTDVVTDPPKVDDVTASAKMRCFLNEHHFVT